MLKILIVDDDLVDYEMILRTLKKSDLESEITHAASVDEGIDAFKKSTFDIVLLDYKMPKRDGIEMVIELRGLPKNESSAIIMMSASEDENLALACIKAGAQDFLTKGEITASRLRRSMQQAKTKYDLEIELHNSYQRIKQLAESDPLTGLANRYMFDESIRIAVAENQRNKAYLALLLFDIDNFKAVNDTHGHDTGDKLLQEITARIQSVLRGNEIFSRFGGDEFAIMVGSLEKVSIANKIAKRITAQMQAPFEINNHTITCSLSIGISIHPNNCDTPVELFKYADIAMYRAKKKGNGNICFFEEEMQEQVTQRYFLEKELRNAVSQGDQFLLHFQPIYKMADGKLHGFEALIRWAINGSFRQPDDFIPLAEETRLIIDIGRWVIQEAFENISKWNTLTHENLSIAINISAIQLGDDGLLEFVKNLLTKHELNPSLIEFELTETALIEDKKQYSETIYGLHSLGCTIALDDFGTGYSSISHLRNFPINTVKIDKSLMPNCDGEEDESLLRGLVAMIRMLKLKAVAEGIENEVQKNLCDELDVDFAQGYYFSRPLAKKLIEKDFIAPLTKSPSLLG